MILRATLVLLGIALAGLHASTPSTYQRSQNFGTAPGNWVYFHPNQFYGYEATTTTGDKGAAGGLFLPKTYFNYYADTFLNGTFHRSTPLTASGRLALERISFDPQYTNSTYICHFARGSNGFINTIGIALTGFNDENVVANAILEFSDGTAYIGDSVGIAVPSSGYIEWTYSWAPTGGSQGFGQVTVQIGGPTGPTSTINLTKTSAGLDFSLDSFGLFQPPFVAPNSNSFLQFDIGHLVYTAFDGSAPTLKIQAPQHIKTQSSPYTLTGTAKTTRGNRVASVRYRVVHNENIGSYKLASGTTNWSARVRLPMGSSRIDVLVTGDNGLTSTGHRNVNRQ